MLRCHRLLIPSIVVMISLLPGCASIGIKNGVPYFSKQAQWEPEVDEDKWGYVGKTARGNRPLEDDNDPFKSVLMSTEAQKIERNLGFK